MVVYLGKKPVGVTKIVKQAVDKTKFGVSIDDIFGNVDENGAYVAPTEPFVVNLSGVKSPSRTYMMAYKFMHNNAIKGVVAEDFVDCNGWPATFYNMCTGSESVEYIRIPNLKTAKATTFAYMGQDCPNLREVDISGLEEGERGALSYAFEGSGLEGVFDLHRVRSLETAFNSWQNAFDSTKITGILLDCLEEAVFRATFVRITTMEKIYFPSLTGISSDSFASSSSTTKAFNNNTGLKEIHFRTDVQALVEATNQYASKWGASNATIYYDLIASITVGGIVYSRNERNSLWTGKTKNFVAWNDGSDNIIYTDYTGNTEPAVGTVVYSDSGTTQVGTVEAVA